MAMMHEHIHSCHGQLHMSVQPPQHACQMAESGAKHWPCSSSTCIWAYMLFRWRSLSWAQSSLACISSTLAPLFGASLRDCMSSWAVRGSMKWMTREQDKASSPSAVTSVAMRRFSVPVLRPLMAALLLCKQQAKGSFHCCTAEAG